jgi:RNA polymerase sigma-70 factor (ECF subfamily)
VSDEADDAALLERARNGDFAAFDRLVGRHERRLYATALAIVRRREDAEDVVQATFLSALEHLAEFRGEAAFGTWVTRIATNAALKVLRRRRAVGPAPSGADGEDDDPLAPPEFIAPWRDDPARIVERRELRAILDEAVAELPEKLRIVFVLRDMAGLDTEETAAAAGISVANAKVRLLRARLALRERLTRVFGDEGARLERRHRHERGERAGGGGAP